MEQQRPRRRRHDPEADSDALRQRAQPLDHVVGQVATEDPAPSPAREPWGRLRAGKRRGHGLLRKTTVEEGEALRPRASVQPGDVLAVGDGLGDRHVAPLSKGVVDGEDVSKRDQQAAAVHDDVVHGHDELGVARTVREDGDAQERRLRQSEAGSPVALEEILQTFALRLRRQRRPVFAVDGNLDTLRDAPLRRRHGVPDEVRRKAGVRSRDDLPRLPERRQLDPLVQADANLQHVDARVGLCAVFRRLKQHAELHGGERLALAPWRRLGSDEGGSFPLRRRRRFDGRTLTHVTPQYNPRPLGRASERHRVRA